MMPFSLKITATNAEFVPRQGNQKCSKIPLGIPMALCTFVLLLAGCGSVANYGDILPATNVGEPVSFSRGATLTAGKIAFPPDFMLSVKSYGAVGDGVHDDTAALQQALSDGRSDATIDYYGRPKALYFPPGVYLIHDTLRWVGCCLTLQGAGTAASVIRLGPGSRGFDNSSIPKPLILTPAGNQSFHQNVWDIGLTVGANNPGATGLSYVSNNSGSVHDVLISSEDGKGHAGIDLTRQYAGPLLIQQTKILGFDVGVDLQNAEYSTVLDNVTVEHQNLVGVRNVAQSISIRGFSSRNSVPAMTNSGGFVVLLNATLEGGSPNNTAVQTDNAMYLRNVSSSGYRATLSSTAAAAPALFRGTIAEYLVGKPQTLTGASNAGSLKLAIAETPSYVDTDLAQWVPFVPAWYGDTSTLQSVFDSGKHTVYFPFATYFSWGEKQIIVPDTVNRIVGFSSIVNGSSEGTNGGGIRLIISSNSTQPLIIEQFGYGMKIDHRGSRPVVIKDAGASYTSSPGAGSLFLEDVEIGSFVVQPQQHVWARQLNDEVNGTKITNQGGWLWVLGMKTEQRGAVLNTLQGGHTELLGGLIYPATAVPSTDAAFISTDSQVSYMYSESVYCSNCGYSTQIQETRNGQTKQIFAPSSTSYRMPLFVGFN